MTNDIGMEIGFYGIFEPRWIKEKITNEKIPKRTFYGLGDSAIPNLYLDWAWRKIGLPLLRI